VNSKPAMDVMKKRKICAPSGNEIPVPQLVTSHFLIAIPAYLGESLAIINLGGRVCACVFVFCRNTYQLLLEKLRNSKITSS
jgi:hypothetical protein